MSKAARKDDAALVAPLSDLDPELRQANEGLEKARASAAAEQAEAQRLEGAQLPLDISDQISSGTCTQPRSRQGPRWCLRQEGRRGRSQRGGDRREGRRDEARGEPAARD